MIFKEYICTALLALVYLLPLMRDQIRIVIFSDLSKLCRASVRGKNEINGWVVTDENLTGEHK